MSIRGSFPSDITIGASDSSPYTVATLPLTPAGGISLAGPVNCMTNANVTVPEIFFDISASGVLHLRNYSSSAKTIRKVFANIAFIAA